MLESCQVNELTFNKKKEVLKEWLSLYTLLNPTLFKLDYSEKLFPKVLQDSRNPGVKTQRLISKD
jgi:hypothetical protein